MSLAARKFREGTAAVNRRDWARYRALLASDFHYTDYAAEICTRTADEFIAHMQEMLAPFSDEQVTIRCLTTTGSTVVGELIAEGTHTGSLVLPTGGELPATFHQFSQHFCVVCEYGDDGVALSCRAYSNPLEILFQLDAAGSTSPAIPHQIGARVATRR